MLDHVHPLAFLGAAKAHDAEFLIGQTERLVIALDPTETNLKPAQEALNAAKALYAAQDYAKAVAQAERAAALALSLNDRFTAYMAAWKDFQACRGELQEIGFPTEGLEAALDAADKRVARPVSEAGTIVPDYLGATETLARAMEGARALVAQARETSREIFLATLAVEALSDFPGRKAPSWMALRLEHMVEQATRELALGHLAAAHLIASEARARADDALAGAARAWERLDMVAAILDGLGAEGPLAASLAAKVAAAREGLARGIPDRASVHALARDLSDETAAFARHYPPARRLLEQADQAYASLRKEGFSSSDVEAALADARMALGNGAWAAVREKVAYTSGVFERLRSEQQALARAIGEIDERVGLLTGFHLPLLPEVQLVLSRAREAARSGRIAAANDELVVAGALMTQATRTGS